MTGLGLDEVEVENEQREVEKVWRRRVGESGFEGWLSNRSGVMRKESGRLEGEAKVI